jgi:tRNA (adenine57-N1/adenine58-N1)-methyltransferase
MNETFGHPYAICFRSFQTRTQIVNELDSSSCILNMDVFPGCTVVESGTGSGCMTLALARAVAPNGHVYTFEYNDTRARTAQEEFKRCSSSIGTWLMVRAFRLL